MLKIKDLCYRYSTGPQILKDIEFSMEEGNFLSILGNNGAGKSTMLKCLNKVIVPNRGSVQMNGEEILSMPPRKIAQKIAFVAQTIPSTQMTVQDMVMLGRKPYMTWGFSEEDHRIVDESLEALDLISMRGRFLNELSGGERQKVMLARALTQQPKLLLLDEPTSSLDIQNQYQVLDIVRDICHTRGIMAMVVLHDINLALAFSDDFLLMKEGSVYDYGDKDILDRKALKQIYNIGGEIVEVKNRKMILVDQA